VMNEFWRRYLRDAKFDLRTADQIAHDDAKGNID
jgi:hypothetical protein